MYIPTNGKFNLDHKGVEKLATPTNGGVQELTFVSEPKQDFSTWVKNRISEYDFVENQDFTTLTKNLVNGGRTTEYYITL